MSRATPESTHFYNTDSEVTPDADPRNPWVKLGVTVPTIGSDGLNIDKNSVVDVATYHRKMQDRDTAAVGPSRHREDAWIQARVRGVQQSGAWGSGASPIALWMRDGHRKIALSIGPDLQLINPDTGAVISTLAQNHPWTFALDYMIRKVGTSRYDVFVDGEKIGEVSYDRAPVSGADLLGRFGFGVLNASGTGEATFENIDMSLGVATPPQWKVDKAFTAIPPLIRRGWTVSARAALRTIVGQVETALHAMNEAWRSLTAERLDVEVFEADGSQFPEDTVPAWVRLDDAPPVMTLVRERVRIPDTSTVADTGFRADFTVPGSPLPNTRETSARYTLIVREYTPDAEGRVGPYLKVRDGARAAYAQLYEDPAGSGGVWFWALTNSALASASPIVTTGHIQWPVNIFKEHTVELQMLRPGYVMLLVDGFVVDRVDYLTATVADVGGPDALISKHLDTGAALPVCTVDISDLYAAQRVTDLNRRVVFEQNALERLVFTSGCDRNDELDTWMRHHQEMEQLRGTTVSMELEIRRLGCCDDVNIVTDEAFANWVLEASYPEVTPIFLEGGGVLSDIYVEFCNDSPNFSDQVLADLLARYLVPTSTTDLQYFIAVAELITGAQTSPNPNETRIRPADVTPFSVGDTITIRTSDNSTKETVTIIAVSTIPVFLDVDELQNTYPIGSVVRKVLATT